MGSKPHHAPAPTMVAQVNPPVHVWVMPPTRTPRLLLRAYRPSDRREFLDRLTDASEQLACWLPLHRPGETDDQVFERHLAESVAAAGRCWRRAVQDDEGRLVGGVNLINIRRGMTFEADANWWIAPEFQRRGFATEAVQALVDIALADPPAGLGLHRVNAMITGANEPSRRLAERLGFRRLAESAACVAMGGVPVAHHLYARTCA
ncbi:MAG: GNAT family N-acetyltransferase [Phycisphaerae bacterium]|nr:GNAT family N-acetyltransferase [Phycisphaerae bacterium]